MNPSSSKTDRYVSYFFSIRCRIPLEDAVYNLIREEVKEPVTLSEIRHRIEKKYETYLSVFEEDGYTGYYYVHSRDKLHSPEKSKNYYPTFNEAMRALILEMGKDLNR